MGFGFGGSGDGLQRLAGRARQRAGAGLHQRPHRRKTRLGADGPEVIGGLYDAWGSCPFEGCGPEEVMAKDAIQLYDRPGPGGKVIGTLAQGEWALVTNTILRHRPPRGVVVGPVRDASPPQNKPNATLKPGDVVYILDFFGEGDVQLARGDDLFGWNDGGTGEQIRFDPVPEAQIEADKAMGTGWWIEVRRANQQIGWTAPEAPLDCLGMIDPSDACRARMEAREKAKVIGWS